jgi:hypothetical protein
MSSGTPVISWLIWGFIAVQIGWAGWAVKNFIRRNDEFPMVVALFLIYCGSYRFLQAYFGHIVWGGLSSFGLQVSADFDSAGQALGLLVFGESITLASYRVWQDKVLMAKNQPLPEVLLSRLRSLLVFLTGAGLPLILWSKYYVGQRIAAGKSLAFEVSAYAQMFPMVLVALAVLLFLAWRFGVLRNVFEKSAAVVLLLVIGYLTFSTTGRFMFLAWIIGGSYIVSTRWFGLKRIAVLLTGATIALALFGAAGAMRNPEEVRTFAAGIERTKRAEDANMLDGLVFLMQVYPKMLPYEYGMGHVEILMRPIPRAWWPGKPVGGYMNKLKLFNAESNGTIGISPTLFGSFYEEGGWVAVFIFSVIYGWLAARIIRYSCELRPLFGVLIRASLLAAVIPLLRGGDLPGIYAWLGMAYWPMFVLFWLNREYLHPETQTAPGEAGQRIRMFKKPAFQSATLFGLQTAMRRTTLADWSARRTMKRWKHSGVFCPREISNRD